MEKKYIDELGFVKISEQRQKIMRDLKNKLKIPTEIAKSTNMSVSEVSRSLKTLKDKEIVIFLNEDKRIGRVYSLTEKGKEILNCIEKYEMV
jgi:DNA-binding MarR family transcriptional regulator